MNKVTRISISGKTSDMFSAIGFDKDNNMVGKEYTDYVPEFFPEEGGDYVCLDIDVVTGHILNWKKPTQAQLKALFKGEQK